MEQEQSTASHMATLEVLGQQPLACLVSDIAASGLGVSPQRGAANANSFNQLRRGDLAQLQFKDQRLGSLKVRCAIEHNSAGSLWLKYIDPQEANVRQLVNWFGNTAGNASTAPPANEAALLAQLCEVSIKQLSFLLEDYLEQCDDRLLGLAERATNNEQQNKYFEVKLQLRQHSRQIIKQCLHNTEQQLLGRPNPNTKPRARNDLHDDMELVDLEEFEDWLSLEIIIKRANARYYTPLHSLAARYSKLGGIELDEETFAIGPHCLCLSLQQALKSLAVTPTLLPVLYRFFEQAVIGQLDDLYDVLNGKLKSFGILPNIDAQISQSNRNRPSQETATPTPTAPILEQPQAEEPTVGEGSTNTGASGVKTIPQDSIAPQLYSAVSDLLNLLRGATPGNAYTHSTATSSAPLAAAHDVAGALGQMQQNPAAVNSLVEGGSIPQWLGEQQNMQLGTELLDQLNLVSAIFGGINQYPQISESIVSELKKLQVPMAKLAITDQQFFSQQEHPAKRLLNRLVELCLQTDMPNAALERNISTIVADITADTSGELDVFQQAATQIDSISTQHSRARNRNTERIAQTYEGRQRVQNAEQAVARALRRRVSPPKAPQVVVELLDNGWRELLKLSYIKQGPNNENWNKHLAALDQLLVWVSAEGDDENALRARVERKLEADAFVELLSQELNNVFPGDYRHLDTIERIRATLKGDQAIALVDLDNTEILKPSNPNQLQKELENANPDLNRWLKRAGQLSVGDEFSYIHDETEQKNIKLAWVSDDRQHFVFVNNRGQKVLDYDLVDLARELAGGLTPTESQSQWPLVERSLYSTLQQVYGQLAFNSSHDELTGLISRKECERLLGNALSASKTAGQQHCLLYLDVDQFSLTNNLHGHVAGDQLLVDISRLLESHAPQSAVVGRMAGNEFILLLDDMDLPQWEQIATQICKTIDTHDFSWQEHPIQLTLSIGLVPINKYTENVVDLLRNAVNACSTAKASGGNRVQNFQQDAQQHNRREKLLSWINKLNTVLSSDKLILRGQKIRPLNTDDDEAHYEILLAIKDEQGKLNSPIEFIEAAEAYNRMQRIDRWVIEHTFIWLAKLQMDGKTLPAVSINLSGNSINDDSFMEFILGLFAQYKIPTSKVCFEVTETATINNLAEAADFIREIKKIGCKFSLDDFGSGNASYQYLKHLPVDYLKIDGMFVQDMENNKNDHALVTSINEIAHLMGKKTIAEYAENETLIRMLDKIGVDYVQGYAVGYPIVLDDLEL